MHTLRASAHPRVAPRTLPARPRWGYLYLALVVVGALGMAAHWAVHEPWMETAVDGVLGFAVFAVMAGWIRINRVALEMPDSAASRRSTTRRIVRRGQRRRRWRTTCLPYDFR